MHNKSNNCSKKIRIRISGDKQLLLHIDEIIYFLAHGKYAYVHTTTEANGELVFRSLSDLEKLLTESSFIRAGRHHLLNINHIYKIDLRKRICTIRIDKENTFDIPDLSERAIKEILKDIRFSVSI